MAPTADAFNIEIILKFYDCIAWGHEEEAESLMNNNFSQPSAADEIRLISSN